MAHPSGRGCTPGWSYSGMFPCLRLGPGSRLSCSVRSATISRGRVSCGTMTSSIYPRSAAGWGLAKRPLWSPSSFLRRSSGVGLLAMSRR